MNIENGIRPVCDALNSIAGVNTVWSCEGHPKIPLRPYVSFVSSQDFAFNVHSLLGDGHSHGQLKYAWMLTANFCDNGILKFTIEPNDCRIVNARRLKLWFLPQWDKAEMDSELLKLACILKTLKN